MAETQKRSSEDDDILADARKEFDRCDDAEEHNRSEYEEDIKFGRLGEQWPADVRKEREDPTCPRPCLTINDLPAFIRQVVNDSRQNKPSIKVQPVDSEADPETAEVIAGLIRNIEYTSSADIAYDTAVDNAASGGFGYWRVGLDYAHDDTFDFDISINRVINPLSIYGDPDSTGADSADWNVAFAVDKMSHAAFERQYKGAEKIDWDACGYSGLLKDAGQKWFDDKTVLVAEYWTRKEVERTICLLSDGSVIDKSRLAEETEGVAYGDFLQAFGVQIEQERPAKSFEVTQRILTGAEILKTRKWPGRYIPIVPVYGDEVYSEGKRHFRSLIRDAKDPQRMENYWRSAATELVALAPKVPFIGPKGAFKSDIDKWATLNIKSWPFVEADLVNGQWIPPARQPLDGGPAAGALQEALNASNDKKRVMGLHDASLGARSNETSGKAIIARQREGDVSTFHFSDNLQRAIRHTGRIIIDLIPATYTRERIVRVLGEDGQEKMEKVNQEVPQTDEKTGEPVPQIDPRTGQPMVNPETGQIIPMTRIIDLRVGKYDVVVKAGPSYTTKREEAATQMAAMVQAVPQVAPILLPMLAKNSDWPGADELAEKLEAMSPKTEGKMPPEMQKMQQQAQEAVATLKGEIAKRDTELQKAGQENASLKLKEQASEVKSLMAQADKNAERANDQSRLDLERYKAETDRYEAETERKRVEAEGKLGLLDKINAANAPAEQPPQPTTNGNSFPQPS